MISVEINKIRTSQAKFKTDIDNQRAHALNQLNNIDVTLFNNDEVDYLTDVKNEFSTSDLLTKTPNELDVVANFIGPIPRNSRAKGQTSLKDFIVEALNYKGLRSTFYPKYFQDIGIKACVYCNSQLTITIVRSDNSISARFDVDHYQSKDKFPFLAICLFNLYPVCAACNRVKSVRRVKFDLYVDKANAMSAFKFKLDESSKSAYLANFEIDKIKFAFMEPSPTPIGYKTFQQVFSIQEIHETQKDVVEELIIRSLIYNNAYRKELRESFSKIRLSDELFDRTIVGNYVQEKDIHKRPLSKMMMDIARDLKIID
jgi:hypothetical protein